MSSKRVRYFYGQLLSVQDLEAEQNYFLEKHKLQNRILLGYGIVSGLGVSLAQPAGESPQVTISPGVAVDRTGNIIVVDKPVVLSLSDGPAWFVTLRYVEIPADPVPVLSDTTEDRMEFSRIEETYAMELQAVDPYDSDADPIVVARLTRRGKRWLALRKTASGGIF